MTAYSHFIMAIEFIFGPHLVAAEQDLGCRVLVA